MKNGEKMKLTTPSDREVVVTRVFDAPRKLVWRAMSEPDLLKRWIPGPPNRLADRAVRSGLARGRRLSLRMARPRRI